MFQYQFWLRLLSSLTYQIPLYRQQYYHDLERVTVFILITQHLKSNISYRPLLFLFRNGCRKLEHLNISWCRKITPVGLTSIAHGCSSLKVLLAKGCINVRTIEYRIYILMSWELYHLVLFFNKFKHVLCNLENLCKDLPLFINSNTFILFILFIM